MPAPDGMPRVARCVVCGQVAFDALAHVRLPTEAIVRRHAFCQEHWRDVATLLDELAVTLILHRTAAELALRLRDVEWPLAPLAPDAASLEE